jgi:hypothetical protein
MVDTGALDSSAVVEGAMLLVTTAVAVVVAVVGAVSRQLHALERCLTLESQLERSASGTPVVSDTVLAVKVAQKLAAATDETE